MRTMVLVALGLAAPSCDMSFGLTRMNVMTVLKVAGLVVSAALFILAGFLAQTPWRAHGGRFVTEYLLLGGVTAAVALIVLAITLRWT